MGERGFVAEVKEGRVVHEVSDGFFGGDDAGVALAATEVPASKLLEGAQLRPSVARPSWVS